MKYYSLTLPSDPKIIGVKNGVTQADVDTSKYDNKETWNRIQDFFSPNSYWEQQDSIPQFTFEVYVKLLKGAKVTDFLQFSPFLFTCPFLIHKKVANVLRSFRLPKHAFYSTTIYDINDSIYSKDYVMLCCPPLEYATVDFEKSTFFTGSNLLGKQYQDINSEEEYVSYMKKHAKIVHAELLVMSQNFDSQLDFFYGRIGGLQVSEGLKEAIEILEFTGVKFLGDFKGKIVIQ